MTITLLHGDCRDLLPTLPERSVQCVVTSPPYFGLRRYDVEGAQIGMEATPAEYVAALVEVFRAVRRVLRDDGVCWINLGDSYSGSWGNYGGRNRGNGTQRPIVSGSKVHQQAYDQLEEWRPPTSSAGPPEKNLLGIPWRVAFALQDDGWILRSDIIWAKPNCMPESVTDRPTRSHEYLFLFAKSRTYYYDAQAIAEQSISDHPSGNGYKRDARMSYQNSDGSARGNDKQWEMAPTRNRRSVWTVPTRPYSGAHFAVFPEQLIEPCILAGSAAQACEQCGAAWGRVVEREGYNDAGRSTDTYTAKAYERPQSAPRGPKRDFGIPSHATTGFRPRCACSGNTGAGRSVVLDPFVGSGTTCRVAERYGRNSIGIDLGYQELQEKRTDGVQKLMTELL